MKVIPHDRTNHDEQFSNCSRVEARLTCNPCGYPSGEALYACESEMPEWLLEEVLKEASARTSRGL